MARGHRVFLHEDAGFRNEGIRDLVWGHNPFLTGYLSDTPNAGGGFAAVRHITDSIVSDWEVAHGLGVQNHYPKIYYEPKILSGLKRVVLVDLTSVSDEYDREKLHARVRKLLKPYDEQHVWEAVFRPNINTSDYGLGDIQGLVVGDIFQYADVLASCRGIITLMSGAAVLASTIKRDEGSQFIKVLMAKDKPIFKFRNAEYEVL